MTCPRSESSEYEKELRLGSVLQALIPDHELLHPDHRLFQTAHLLNELAWSQLEHDLRRVAAALDEHRYGAATRLLDRATALGDVAVRSVELLQDHLSQRSLLTLRNRLPDNATGLDSPGNRALRRTGRTLWKRFEAALAREGLVLADLDDREEDGPPTPLALVRVAMLRLDNRVLAWNQCHLRMVWSHLGGHPATRAADGALPSSLAGNPISVLESTSDLTLFPALWRDIEDRYHQRTPARPERPAP